MPATATWDGGSGNWWDANWTIPPPAGFDPEDMPAFPNNSASFQFDVVIDGSGDDSVVNLVTAAGLPDPEISNLSILDGERSGDPEQPLASHRPASPATPSSNAGVLSIDHTAELQLDGGPATPGDPPRQLQLTGGGIVQMLSPTAEITKSGGGPPSWSTRTTSSPAPASSITSA